MPVTAVIAAVLVSLLGTSSAALAQIARVIDSKGTSIVERAGKPSRILGQGEQLDEKDVISVARDSFAILEFKDQTRITLRPNTVFRLDTYRESVSESMLFGLVKGGLRAVTGLIGRRNPSAVTFQTATATIGIRGTEFDARLCEDDCAAEERHSTQPGFPVAARLVDFKGSVEALNFAGVRRKLVPGSYVRVFDEVRTARGSYAVLLLRDHGRLVLHPDTRVVFHRFKYDPARPADAEVDLMLLAGRIGTQTGSIGKARAAGYRINMRFARLETRGTTTEVRCTGTCAESAPTAGAQRPVVTQSKPKMPTWTPPSAGSNEPQATLSLVLKRISPPAQAFAPQSSTSAPTSTSTQASTPTDTSASDWRTQTMSAEAKQALIAFAQQIGLPGADQMESFLGMYPSATYEQLMQTLQVYPEWSPVVAMFAGASDVNALVVALNAPPDWRLLAISEQVKQALLTYAQQHGGDVAVMQQLLNDYPSYGLLQQVLEQVATYAPWIGEMAAMLAGANSVDALAGALNASDWRTQAISEQGKQAIQAYLQQLGIAAADVVELLNDFPTYGQLQLLLEQVAPNVSWAGPLGAMIAGANSFEALLTAFNAPPPDWRTQTMSAEAKQALIAFAQQTGLPGADQMASMLLSGYSSLTYEQLQQMFQSEPAWAPVAAMFAGANSVTSLIAAFNAPPDWRMLAISEQVKQALLTYAQQHGGDVAVMQQLLNDYPTYGLLQQVLDQASSMMPWVSSLAAMFLGANSVDALFAALNASDWRTQAISEQGKQAIQSYLQQLGIAAADVTALLNEYPTYGKLQQLLEQVAPNVLWAGPLGAMIAGANSVTALITGLQSLLTQTSTPAQTSYSPEAAQFEVSVTEGAIEVTTSSGTQTVNAGQSASMSRPGSPLLLAGMKPQTDGPGAPNPQMPGIDSGGAFGDEPPAQLASGLYVWVRDGAVQLSKDGTTLDVPAGSAALATAGQIVPLDAVPNFMRFDATPRPLPAVGQRVSDAFVAPDGSQSLMCTVR